MKLPKEIIDINEDWGMSSDSTCVTVYKKVKNKKTGKMYYSATWYYNNFVQAFQALVDRDIQLHNSFHDMVNRIEVLRKDIEIAMKELDKWRMNEIYGKDYKDD